jgi:hypothetical protein
MYICPVFLIKIEGKMKRSIFKILLYVLFSISNLVLAQVSKSEQEQNPTGNISGSVVDLETKQALIGVNIVIKSSGSGVITDSKGEYQINQLKVDTYTLVFSYLGFEQVVKTDVVVRPGRTTYLNVDLRSSSIEMESVVVEGGYFSEVEAKPMGTINFSAEEVRRAPGSAGDVSRIVMGLPSLAKVNDSRNSLIVRGGSPVENSFYLDNIEIPNINHFQIQGSSDGPIGLLNVDFIKDVNFYSGGFSPIYGDKLSSIMEISFREGTLDGFNPQLQMSMAGFGAGAEGPIGDNGSYMFSASRSYLDLIVDQVETGGALPKYGDFQGKLTYKLNDNNKVTLINVFSKDDIANEYNDALEAEENFYGVSDDLSNVTGINWQYIWTGSGYSNTSVAFTHNSFDRDYYETKSQLNVNRNITKENSIKLRNVNYYKTNNTHAFEFGIDANGILNTFDFILQNRKNQYGNILPTVKVDRNLRSVKAGLFAVHHWNLTDRLKLIYGGRVDYFEYTDKLNISPRINLSYKIDSKTTLNASAGVFHQDIPSNILVQNDAFKNLQTPRSTHFVLGISRMIGESTRLTIEAYQKDYNNFPINPATPNLFLFDQVMVDGLFLNHSNLVDDGKAFSRGVEVMLQKKLASDFYGMISGSYSKSRYKDLNGTWRDRIYDNEFNFTLEGGYIPNNEWEFKVRWIYAGGAPYTPFNLEESEVNNHGVWDLNRINSERLPDYHSLNIRVDKRFNFSGSNLILYLSIWNAYGRKNIAAYQWNEITNEQEAAEQWSTLPVLGFEFEF